MHGHLEMSWTPSSEEELGKMPSTAGWPPSAAVEALQMAAALDTWE